MSDPVFFLYLLGGLVLGTGLTWLFLRGKIREARMEGEAERAILEERLRGKEQLGQEWKAAAEKLAAEASARREELKAESERRSAAEERNLRIPGLEAELQEREELLVRLRGETTDLKTRLSELETKLEEERKGAEEKMALLDEARQKLSDTFRALSAEALRTNNQSFLDLARTHLEKFQEGARGDPRVPLFPELLAA